MASIDPAFFTFKQLVELDACTRCGECVKWCPTYTEAQFEEITPLQKIHRVRSFLRGQYGGWLVRLFGFHPPTEEEIELFSKGTYDCTLCGRCRVVCPVNIDTRPLWIAMREQLVGVGQYPPMMDNVRQTITSAYNISGAPNDDRLIWSENLERIPEGVRGKEEAEVVYFVGCVGAFYPTAYGIAQTFVQILERAGVDFTTLGPDEWCCGFPVIIAGMGESGRELAAHNVEAVRKTGARKLVTTCPSCFRTWQDDYPRILGQPLGFEVWHATQLVWDLIRAGRIRLGGFEMPVTYHDPCDLGRGSGIYDKPREIIRSIPGIQFTEMQEAREHSLCCGGGGDVEMANAELTTAVARRRVEQAQATGAKVILSACQQCKRTLAAATRKERVRMRILDLMELVWQVMRGT